MKEILEYVQEQQKLDREERAAWRNIQMAELQEEDKKRADNIHMAERGDEIKIQIANEAAKEQAKIEADKELALKVYTEGFRIPVLNRRVIGCKSINLYLIL